LKFVAAESDFGQQMNMSRCTTTLRYLLYGYPVENMQIDVSHRSHERLACAARSAGRAWLLAILLLAPEGAMAAAEGPSNCDSEFGDLLNSGNYPDLQGKIQRWNSLAQRCAGSGIYESRLGVLYTEAGNFGKARNILQRGLELNTVYDRNLRVALADLSFRQGDLVASEQESLETIRRFPDFAGGYLILGQTYLATRRFPEGIQNLEKSNSLEKSASANIMLAMAYYQVRRPRDAVEAMRQAVEQDGAAIGHTQAVCATAFSLVELGFAPQAKELLEKHLEVKPTAADDPTFRQAIKLVATRLNPDGTPPD
jgi:tetratricopeptide (TPR) repeat protein